MWQPGMTLEYVEKDCILQAMKYFGGNKTATSKSLGIAIRTLDEKLKRYKKEEEGIDERRSQQEELQRRAIDEARFGKNGKGSKGWDGLEPSDEAPGEQPLSVSVGSQVQEMPQAGAARRHPSQAR